MRDRRGSTTPPKFVPFSMFRANWVWRYNVTLYRQTQFALNMLNGTNFGGVVDPRLSRMLAPAPDGQYRGLDANVNGFGALTATQQPNNFFGYAGTGGLGVPSRYIF